MTERLRIVLVEDDALIAMDLADLLIGMDYDVLAIAGTEDEAVAAAERYKPNLMIVDANLSEGTGVSAMRQILAHGFIPHFYTTGDPQLIREQVKDAIIVAKPFNLSGLMGGIAQARRATA
ncbi:response regulator [Sphingobium sp. D43FB]|uniref:response regulator n=1 Tax=Sphingobium sp. D43FB TaxID=2017595 RepID=UPI000BB57D6B|nr:response regulator [Sphingobium sp. D43FB]PBN43585.1 response regulator [Sphingobium sp. D43FB]